MMKPTKVWKFNDVYAITVWDNPKVTAQVVIGWSSGQSIYDRACLDLLIAMTTITEEGWTASDCEHERVEDRAAIRSFSVVNQFVDKDEALRLAAEFSATLKELSGLP